MSSINPHYRSVQQLLQSRSFAIDEYQREYKWDKDNIEELLSDLTGRFLTNYQEGHPTSRVSSYESYFLGSIIVTQRDGKSYLVDGQQRVTSLTLLLIYLYRAATAKGLNVVQTIGPLIFSDNLGEAKFNLDIPERLPVLEALFNGDPFNSEGKDESIQTMFARYKDIEESGLLDEIGEGLTHFIYWLLTRVGLIEIVTDSDSAAYAIFETMNDRGKPLSPVDMLKAYLLAPIDDSDKRNHANQTWKDRVLSLTSWKQAPNVERDSIFIKAWLRAQHATSMRDRKAGSSDQDWELIGNVFHRWVRENQARLNLGTAVGNLSFIEKETPFFTRAYLAMLAAMHEYKPGWEPVFYNSHNEFTWQTTVLLAPLVPSDDNETVRKKMVALATYLDIWLMRRVVNYTRVAYSSASYSMYNLCLLVRQKPLEDLVEILIKDLADDDFSFDGNPAKLRYGIPGLYLNQFSRRYIFHLLARFNSFVESGSGKPDLFASYINRKVKNPFDIEHIRANKYTQYQDEFATEKEFQEQRNHVAALLLLPADVNRSLQDKPFDQKLPSYGAQNLFAASLSPQTYQHQPQFAQFRAKHNLPFKPYAAFGKTEQAERCELLLALANCIWSPDRLKQVLDQ